MASHTYELWVNRDDVFLNLPRAGVDTMCEAPGDVEGLRCLARMLNDAADKLETKRKWRMPLNFWSHHVG